MFATLILSFSLVGAFARAQETYPTNVILSEGELLLRGQFGYSPSGVYSYGVSDQGSLQFKENTDVISETGPTDGTELKLLNGVLVFNGRNWTSRTQPRQGVRLIISDRGHVGLYAQFDDFSAGGSFWHRGIDAGATPILDGPGPPPGAITSLSSTPTSRAMNVPNSASPARSMNQQLLAANLATNAPPRDTTFARRNAPNVAVPNAVQGLQPEC